LKQIIRLRQDRMSSRVKGGSRITSCWAPREAFIASERIEAVHARAPFDASLQRARLVKLEIVFAALVQQVEDRDQGLFAALVPAHCSWRGGRSSRGDQRNAPQKLGISPLTSLGDCVGTDANSLVANLWLGIQSLVLE
jgi:hypothetical protein